MKVALVLLLIPALTGALLNEDENLMDEFLVGDVELSPLKRLNVQKATPTIKKAVTPAFRKIAKAKRLNVQEATPKLTIKKAVTPAFRKIAKAVAKAATLKQGGADTDEKCQCQKSGVSQQKDVQLNDAVLGALPLFLPRC